MFTSVSLAASAPRAARQIEPGLHRPARDDFSIKDDIRRRIHAQSATFTNATFTKAMEQRWEFRDQSDGSRYACEIQ